ncbi:hypothetical protein EVA_19127 [gut metagenome]|uniref:Uncharacterized protein n=1 Tax=gut metagenome TaxID=749906 RepID=J9FCZ0_9ZZZZ
MLSQRRSSERLPTRLSCRLGTMKSRAFICAPTNLCSLSRNIRKLAVEGTVTRS